MNETETALNAKKTISSKFCNFCQTFLPMNAFHKNKNKIDGYQDRCKDCIKDYQKLSSQQRQNILEKTEHYIPNIYLVGYGRSQTFQISCLKCEKSFFHLAKNRNFQDLFCDSCSADQKFLKEENISNVYYVGNTIGWIVKTSCEIVRYRKTKNYKKAYERDKYTCQYCGYNLQSSEKFLPLHIDHIKPWSASGGNSLANLAVACSECNLLASSKWFQNFEEKKDYILDIKKLRKRKEYL